MMIIETRAHVRLLATPRQSETESQGVRACVLELPRRIAYVDACVFIATYTHCVCCTKISHNIDIWPVTPAGRVGNAYLAYSAFRQKFPKLWTSVAHSFLQQIAQNKN